MLDLYQGRMGRAHEKGRRTKRYAAPSNDREIGVSYETVELIAVVTLPKVFWSLVPSFDIAEIAATAMRAAIRPYSIAVAPLLFFRNLRM